ncbi:MAG: DoxX family membrane protein [Pseudobdellovibrio sp.]
MKKIILLLRLIAAGIIFQTLYFKFTASPESVYIFTQLHVEPWGRLFAGFSELIAGILLLIPITQSLGAIVAFGIMLGAILSHLFVLGISVQNDNGLLFILAVVVLFSSAVIVYFQKQQLFGFKKLLLIKLGLNT